MVKKKNMSREKQKCGVEIEALLAVARAASVVMRNYDNQVTSVIAWDALSYALDRLPGTTSTSMGE